MEWFIGSNTSPLEALYWASQIGILLVLLAAAWFAYRQLTVFERFELWKSLQGSEVRAARSTVFNELAGKDFSDWDDSHIFAASTVCASYDVVGRLMREKSVRSPVRCFLVDSWAPSVVGTYKILGPFIDARAKVHGDDYFAGFKWLYQESLKSKSITHANHPAARTSEAG